MNLPDHVLEDMAKTFKAIKLRTGLEFYVIPQKNLNEPAWVLIDKAAKIRPRFTQALRFARTHKEDGKKVFNIQKIFSGRIELVGKKIYFILEEEAAFPAEKKMRTKWAVIYKKLGDEVAKLGILLKKASIVTEAEATRLDASEDEDYGDELSPGEIAEVFGADATEVQGAAMGLSELNEAFSGVRRMADDRQAQAASKLLTAGQNIGDTPIAEHLENMVPGFLRFAVTGGASGSTGVGEGEELPDADKMLEVAASFNAYNRCLIAWEARLVQAEAIKQTLDALEEAKAAGGLTEDQQEEFNILSPQYMGARASSLAAKERADQLQIQIEASFSGVLPKR